MRREAAGGALVAQSQSLLHAKAVLLVDDRQAQVVKLHFVLKQCVSAHHHGRLAGGDHLQLVGAGLTLEFACDPGNRQSKRGKPALEVVKVLFSKNLGRCHQRDLPAGFQCL